MLVENRYFKDLTQSEVAKIMDVNQVYVSRMEKKVLKKKKNSSRSTLYIEKCPISTMELIPLFRN